MSINLRKELKAIFDEDKEFDRVVVRHLTDTKCICLEQPPMIYDSKACVDIPNPNYRTTADPNCSNCEGSGWVFKEYLLKCKYFYPPFRISHNQDFEYGITLSNSVTFYFYPSEEAQNIRPDDMIFLIDFHTNGRIKLPITRRQKWAIIDKYNLHLDHNKFEVIKIFAKPVAH